MLLSLGLRCFELLSRFEILWEGDSREICAPQGGILSKNGGSRSRLSC